MQQLNGESPPQAHSVETHLNVYDAYVFDMDGTIYLGEELLPGVLTLMDAIKSSGKKRVFLTNNPTKTREHYASKLSGLGVETRPDEVITSATLTAAWLKQFHPDAICFALGEQPLLDALTEAGVQLSDEPSEITMVITSYDRTFDYRKLQIAFDALWKRPEVHFISTHPDAYCPFPFGRGEPDAAAITAAITGCTGRHSEQTLGKPSAEALLTALRLVGVSPGEAIMVGDRLATDIAMGVAAGASTALVLTGDSTREDAEAAPTESRPEFILDTIETLAHPLLKATTPTEN